MFPLCDETRSKLLRLQNKDGGSLWVPCIAAHISSDTLISPIVDYLFKDFGIVNSLERQR